MKRTENRQAQTKRPSRGEPRPKPHAPTPAEDWMNVADACEVRGFSESTMRHYIRRGDLETTRQGRYVWVSAKSVREYAQDSEGRISERDAAELLGCSSSRGLWLPPGSSRGRSPTRRSPHTNVERRGVQARVGREARTPGVCQAGGPQHSGRTRSARGRRGLGHDEGGRGTLRSLDVVGPGLGAEWSAASLRGSRWSTVLPP